MVRVRPPRRSRSAASAAEPRPVRRVAMYLRVSTDDQAESGLGIEAQRTQARAMATVKGWPEPVEYLDSGISGAKGIRDRPALRQLLEDAEAGIVDAVIVSSLDRLARRIRITLEVVDRLAEKGVTLVTCRESFDTSTPTGQFVLTLFAALAEMERELIMQRTRAALEVKSARDGDAGGTMPYGYARSEDEATVIDEQEAKIVRDIFAWRRRGKSLRWIASALNDRCVPSPRGDRHIWWASSVREVLLNRPFYKGGKRGDSAVCWPKIL